MPNGFHHIFVCQNFIIKCVKIHSFEFLPNQHKYTILYNKNQIYSSENKTILRYHTARRYRICSFKETTTIPKSLIGRIFLYEKQVSKNDDCLLSWLYHSGNYSKFCTVVVFDLSSDVSDFTWKDSFYFNGIFFTQLLIDLFCAKYVDKIGYRKSVVASEILSAAGLIGLAFLPSLLPDPYVGILISVIIYAMGSGLIEVLVSPIVEACPFDNKDSVMSLLHSFYCWGSVGVILLSTIFLPSLALKTGAFYPASGLWFHCAILSTSSPVQLNLWQRKVKASAYASFSIFQFSGLRSFLWSVPVQVRFLWLSGPQLM